MPETLPRLSQEFHDFLLDAKHHGYRTGVRPDPTVGGGNQIYYKTADWLYVDNWIGGDPFDGYERVSVKHRDSPEGWLPVWAMTYHGGAEVESFVPEIGGWLDKVLPEPELTMPLRGPFSFTDVGGTYHFEYSGTLERFIAQERIARDGVNLYIAKFRGGLSNRRRVLEQSPQRWLAHEAA